MENKVIAKEYVKLHYVPYEQYVSKLNEVNEKWKNKIKKLKERIQKIYDESPVDEFGIHNCQDTGWIEDMLDEILEDKQMTVREMIEKLNKIEDKEKIVLYKEKDGWDNIELEEQYYNVYVYCAGDHPFDFN